MTLNELKRKENLDFNILSERLLLKRTDRPDEWSMDELASMALKIEARVKDLECYERQLKHQEDLRIEAEKKAIVLNDKLCMVWKIADSYPKDKAILGVLKDTLDEVGKDQFYKDNK